MSDNEMTPASSSNLPNINSKYGTFEANANKATQHLLDNNDENEKISSPIIKVQSAASDDVFDFDNFLLVNDLELGRFQIFVVCLLIIPGCFLSAFSTLDLVFMAYTPSYQCAQSNTSTEHGLSDQCFAEIAVQNGSINETFLVKCSNWTYDKSYFTETLVTEWDLICSNALTIRTIISIMNVASIIATIFTFVQDRYGRKMAFLCNLTVYLFGCCSSLWASTPIAFATLKFIGSISCMFSICYCWALEFIGSSKRSNVAVTMSFVYALANIFMVFIGYFTSTWRQFGSLTSFPFILLFSYLLILPESPRWLLTMGKYEEALKVLKRMAQWQNIQINVDDLRKKLQKHQALQLRTMELHKKGETICFDFFRSKNLVMKNLLLTLATVVTNQLYTAVPFNVENLDTNFYVSYVLQAVAEPPAILTNLLFLNRIGRVLPLSISMMVAGLACILTWPMDAVGSWGSLAVTILSRFLVCIGIPITQQLTNELYPTVARGTGNGVTLIATGLSSITTQYVLYTGTVWKSLPMIIMGSLCCLIGCLVAFLPETKGLSLPDTIEEAEKQGAVGLKSFKANFTCYKCT